MPGRPGGAPRPNPHAQPHEEEHGGGGEHECPGHGPDDPPPPINLWRGLLGVNNERAQQGGFLNQLLYRYENKENPCDPKNEPPPYTASLINFAVLVLILFRFGQKPLAEALTKRKQTIMAEIDTATRLLDDAEERLADYEDKLENIEDKRAEMLAEYAAQAEVEKKHLLAEAEERRARMKRDAEFRVEQELKAAQEELLREAIVAATAAAEALVQKQISRADHDRMAEGYLKSVGGALSAGGIS
jgi:F-type H+-transporting ATPase subunit b